MDGVGLVLVEGDEHECVLQEFGVSQQRVEEVLEPFSCGSDGGVVSVGGHVGGDEHPLWEFISGEVFKEHGGVLDQGSAVGLRDDGVVKDGGAS